MIKNDRQYKTTLNKIADLVHAAEVDAAADSDLDPGMRDMVAQGLASQIAVLQAEADVYEGLRSDPPAVIRLRDLGGLPDALIQARIASGLTQAELAARVGIHENVLQRYETSGFGSVAWQRVVAILDCLDVPVVVEDLKLSA